MSDVVKILPAQSTGLVVLARKSWMAWVGWTIIAAFILIVVTPTLWGKAPAAAIIVALAIVAGTVYKVALARSYVLYMDDSGIWLRRGVLPWSKGVVGVKWRDLDGALYFTGFVSWATNSYTVHLGHRFTKSSEIHISHMHAGKKAVETINGKHAQMIQRAG